MCERFRIEGLCVHRILFVFKSINELLKKATLKTLPTITTTTTTTTTKPKLNCWVQASKARRTKPRGDGWGGLQCIVFTLRFY